MEVGFDQLVYELANCPENLVQRIMRVFGGVDDIFFFHASMFQTGTQFFANGKPLVHNRDFIIYRQDVLIFHESQRT